MRFGQLFPGLVAVLASLLLAREAPMQLLESAFRLAKVAGVLYRVAFRIGGVGFQAHIDAFLLAGRHMLNSALGFHAELDIVAVCPSHDAHPFDLFGGKSGDSLLLVANQSKATDSTAIGETDMFAILIKLPARRFVLDAPVVVLKLGIALFAGCVLLAVVVEAGNSQPGTVGTGLPRLGVETSGKGIGAGQHRTVALQVGLSDAALIHPLAQALVPDELDDANGLVDGGVLLLGTLTLVFVGQHPSCLSRVVLLHYTAV